jgi:ribonucleotide reductase alpha subunit
MSKPGDVVSVVKRDGSLERLNIEKIHRQVLWATEGISGVSASELEIRSQLQFYDGIHTRDIQETLIKAAADLIDLEAPNYQFVAAKLINHHIRKEAYNSFTPPSLHDHVTRVIQAGFYTAELLEWYSPEEFAILDTYMDHEKDMNLTYAAMEQWRGKYLVKNRVTNQLYETPQMALMLIAATLFNTYPVQTRLKWVKDFYDAISNHDISLPTPIMAGVRTPQKQFSSCVLIESDDSLDSISAVSHAVVRYVSRKAGIGLNIGRIRAINSPIRGGDAYHTGVVPFVKLLQASVKSCNQGSIRGGAATAYFPFWHLQFEDMVVLKNNKGTDDNRARHMDYGVQFCKLAYERLIQGGDLTLFSPSDVPGLYDAFFVDQDEFKRLYEQYEADPSIRKKTLKAVDLFTTFMHERKNTGRVYVMNVDHCNTHGAYIEHLAPIRQSNLCLTGDSQLRIQHTDGTERTMELASFVEAWGYGGMTGVRVRSYDTQTGKFVWSVVSAAAQTATVTELMEIDHASGNVIRCTPDHEIWTQNRGWVMAQNLTVSDLLQEDVNPGAMPSTNHIADIRKIQVAPTPVYDITVPETSAFVANNLVVHNCAEITLPTMPLQSIEDTNPAVALCTLAAINWGKIREPKDFEKPCKLAVRALDALLDYQDYPLPAAEAHTRMYRPLGIGIVSLAYWIAKMGFKYSDDSALQTLDEYAEAWSYYMIRASVDLAMEKGACPGSVNTKYHTGIVPIDTRKRDTDELVSHAERMPWDKLREDLRVYGIRNTTLMACMPSEASSLISNATNGVEPPRGLISVKQSKDGVMKQVVPEYRRLKNRYELLWDQRSPEGYLKVCAVLQRWMDQTISTNTSYNPEFYPDNQLPMSDLLRHMLMAYKWGIKTQYYFNTLDGQSEVDVDKMIAQDNADSAAATDDTCESCTI